MHSSDIVTGARELFNTKSAASMFLARQLLWSGLPASNFVESYLYDNEGKLQNLDLFPMMRDIYDTKPQKLLLKCSRKTLKSTLLSNIICLNTLRWNYYAMLYVAPQEAITQLFSNLYINPRFESPKIKASFIKGWEKNDVYQKFHADTNSSILFKYASDDASRCRGPSTHHNFYDEVQDISFDIIPVISETMAMLPTKRECFAGTPLTTDNTIAELWRMSNQLEWAMKCQSCNHWNMLTIDNDPVRMIGKKFFCCSKCERELHSENGMWVSTRTQTTDPEYVGYHLAQPFLPHYNRVEKSWKEIYSKVHSGKYGKHQIYNEVFGLDYDVGSKPISKEELVPLCQLGSVRSDDDIKPFNIWKKNKQNYRFITTGVDWGVNSVTSRTSACHGGLRSDGVFEVFNPVIYHDTDYDSHMDDIAQVVAKTRSVVTADGGPDPFRSYKLADLCAAYTGLSEYPISITRYQSTGLVTKYLEQGLHWKENRFLLHRSDCISYTFRMLKAGKVLFPVWSEVETCMQDILAEFVEMKDNGVREEIAYRHPANKPDDFLHALTYALITAGTYAGDRTLSGSSSSAGVEIIYPG